MTFPSDAVLLSRISALRDALNGSYGQSADAIVAAARAGTGGGARWWCGQCSAFARPDDACTKCRHPGPHVFSEDAPTGGNAARRARLRAQHKHRNRLTR